MVVTGPEAGGVGNRLVLLWLLGRGGLEVVPFKRAKRLSPSVSNNQKKLKLFRFFVFFSRKTNPPKKGVKIG